LRHRIIVLCLIIYSGVVESVKQNSRLCSGCNSYILTFRCGGKSSVTKQSAWDLWWRKCDWFLFKHRCFPLSVNIPPVVHTHQSLPLWCCSRPEQTHYIINLIHIWGLHFWSSTWMDTEEGRLVFNGVVICPGTIIEYLRKNKTIL
jgi:hypothetical protein